MTEQERNNKETEPKFLCLPYTKQRKFLSKKSFLRKRASEGLNKKRKKGFITALATATKKDSQRQKESPLMNWKFMKKLWRQHSKNI